jgi:hypothetical protein
MARRIVSTLLDALTREWTRNDVHFHAHAGRPFPCYDRDCVRPRQGEG